MSLAVPTMAKSGRPKGRPKGDGRLTGRFAIVHSPEYRTWMEAFMEYVGESDISETFREGVRLYAEAKGFRSPPNR